VSTDRVTGRTYPTVEIAGQEYTLKPLPASVAFDLAEVIEMGFGTLLRMSQQKDGQVDASAMMQVIVAVLRKNKAMFTGLFARLLGVKEEEFNNGQRFPLSTFVIVLRSLGDHPDVEDFLSEIVATMDEIPETVSETTTGETLSPEPSGSSESMADTPDGQTNAS